MQDTVDDDDCIPRERCNAMADCQIMCDDCGAVLCDECTTYTACPKCPMEGMLDLL